MKMFYAVYIVWKRSMFYATFVRQVRKKSTYGKNDIDIENVINATQSKTVFLIFYVMHALDTGGNSNYFMIVQYG